MIDLTVISFSQNNRIIMNIQNKRNDDMNIMILHLSDMHFNSNNNFSSSNISAITNALREHIEGIDNILIIISGDLPFSGKCEEYKQVCLFLNKLGEDIVSRYGEGINVKFSMVPGNHDVDYNNGEE